MSADVRDGATAFVDKWRARWPEWTLAMVFVPTSQRTRVESWFALLQELTDAAWGGGDPTPGLAKLAWWQEELSGWSRGARRHPLGAALQPCVAPWRELGLALPALRALRDGQDVDSGARGEAGGLPTMVADHAFALAVANCEHALFGGRAVDAAAGAAVAATLDGERRLSQGGHAGADPGSGSATSRPGSRPRAIHGALLQARRRAAGRAVRPLPALFAAWRGARATT